MRVPLHDGWTVEVAGGSGRAEVPEAIAGAVVPAEVPGCVHTDLLAAGLIPDPYLDGNEAELAWIGRTDWRYRTTFDWQPKKDNAKKDNAEKDNTGKDAAENQDQDGRVDLVCEGLDTVARIEL